MGHAAMRVARSLRCVAVRATVLATAGCLGSCSLFDSGVEWRGGPYELSWIDVSESMAVCRGLGGGSCIGRIDSTVFAVGWDGRYLVAQQHPGNDRSKTQYFILDANGDTDLADPGKVVIGPLTASEFARRSSDLHLPGFSKVLASLQ
jgi:hypothetical protein